ncbi:MAG: hypothetical protein H6509_08280 [Bryobacterales bacterium]|nr:hypothetical protein [Bryobacterales bacterium]
MQRLPLLWLLFVLATSLSLRAEGYEDKTHFSQVFQAERTYRLFLPPDYSASEQRYPVIYYFHGHSDRYTLSQYDDGKDTVPKILDFVAHNPVIVIAVDGYVAEHYQGFYGGSPWDVREDGGDYDFGKYFLELVAHVDSSYRTLTGRRHRATSGLSMGGFMSLYLSARYPDWIGSASSFNPGPEFFTGDKGRRILWRPKDHVSSHGHTMVRLIRASGDYISQYHEETRDAYARAREVDFEFRQDEYHRHWATSIGETFAFHQRAFANAALDNPPLEFAYANAYREFTAWDYQFRVEDDAPAYVYLDEVRQGSMRIRTRRWAPDGPPAADAKIHVRTAPLYKAGADYQRLDHNLATGETERETLRADAEGRLSFTVDGAGHQISFVGPGTSGIPPVLLPTTTKDRLLVPPNEPTALPVRIYNPRGEALEDVRVEISTQYPTAALTKESVTIEHIGPGEEADLSGKLSARFTSGDGDLAPVRFEVTTTYDGWLQDKRSFYVDVIPERMPPIDAVEILDGRTFTFQVFRQQGNQGGGSTIERTVTEGSGDGDGVLEPGETATVWVRIPQGLDPFDKNSWHRAKVRSRSPWVEESEDLREEKQREWTGAQHRSSVIRLTPDAPKGEPIPLLLECESWSFVATPDVRYGTELHYQPIQRHRRHLFKLEVRAR